MASFPALPSGSISEFPYSETDVFYVAQSALPCGLTTTYAQNASAKKGFVVTYTLLSESELATLEDFWNSVAGSLGYFSFTDDNGVTYDTCRFDQQSFAVIYNDVGQIGLTLRIRVV